MLLLDGDAYPSAEEGPWDFQVGVTTDGTDFIPLVALQTEVWPNAVAWWKESLYLGMDDGSVWRAEGGWWL